jgi:hypothetical protein
MLSLVRLVQQWARIEQTLPEDWADARLRLFLADDSQRERTLALLGPLSPGRQGDAIRFFVARRGAGPGAQAVKRGLRLLDQEGIRGAVQLLESARLAPAPVPEDPARAEARTIAESWDAALAELPPDWSDLYCELELRSSDDLDRAALAMAPLNPLRYTGNPGFRFRAARSFGYGASPQMTRRCLARLDEAGIPGRLRMLRVLSDTRPAETQGPVWYAGGKVL